MLIEEICLKHFMNMFEASLRIERETAHSEQSSCLNAKSDE